MLRAGGLLAHATSTIPGVTALPNDAGAIRKLERFKQRHGPFVILAGSAAAAMRFARYLTPAWRKLMREQWPGRTTLIFPAKPGLAPACYQRGKLAVRVDADTSCRQLAGLCGGYILSSSLNRKGQPWQQPSRRHWLRWHHYLQGFIGGGESEGAPSVLFVLTRSGIRRLR